MAESDLQALGANYERWLGKRGNGLTGVNPFNYYCVQNFLKPYPIDDNEMRGGIVDKSLDGGIDAFYFFANRKYVLEHPVLDPDSEYRINLVIFQIKEGTGFSPNEVQKHYFFLDDLLDITRPESKYQDEYHSGLKKLMKVFKDQYNIIAGTMPQIAIDFFYVSKLDCGQPRSGSDVLAKVARVKGIVSKHFSHATCNYHFNDAPLLLAQAALRKNKNKSLTWHSAPIEAPEGWVGLVNLHDYYEFLKDENGDFNEDIVAENVRGFLQRTYVNVGIDKTLLSPADYAEFWLLNNGITILAKEAQSAGFHKLSISDPQIVNGLQSSRQIHKYFKSTGAKADNRRILLRVIKVADNSRRDQIIRATNSQNPMSEEMLRATDPIHLKIEEVFGQYGLFYDRRKGYYKDQGESVAKIISMREVLQAMLAIALRRPNDARARPLDYLRTNEKYDEVFKAEAFNLMVYLKATEIVRRIEMFLEDKHSDQRDHFRNLIFYIAMCVACTATKNAYAPPSYILKIDTASIADPMIEECYNKVWSMYQSLQVGGVDADVVAKGNEMTKQLQTHLKRRFSMKKKRKSVAG